MKICFVTAHYSPFAGGVETHVERIAAHLAAGGDDVTLLTQSDDPSWPIRQTIDGVDVHRHAVPLRSRHFPVAPELFRSLRNGRRRFDVVHAHGYHSIAPLFTALSGARPMVFTPHYHGTGHSPLRKALHVPYRSIGTGLAKVSNAVICVSEAERTLYLSHFPKAESKVSVIPNGADLEPILAAEPMPTDKRIVMSAGRLESYKHVDRTIQAMGRLGDEYELIVTGDGPERQRLQNRTKELRLEHRVRFLGRVEVGELYRWFRAAEVYVSMSTNEAMPVTVCETLACGARVVLSDIPAHRDLQARFGDAITVVGDDASASDLASSIEEAFAGQRTTTAVPTWKEVAAATRAVYERVLDHG